MSQGTFAQGGNKGTTSPSPEGEAQPSAGSTVTALIGRPTGADGQIGRRTAAHRRWAFNHPQGGLEWQGVHDVLIMGVPV